MDAIWMLGFARNIAVFSGKRRFRCREKLARVCGGFGRRRFAADSCSICARSGTEGSRWLFLLLVDAVLLCFACLETLCALELVHQSDVFYSGVLQFYCVVKFSLCRSRCLERYCTWSLVVSCDSDCVWQVIVGRSQQNCYIIAVWMLGFARNIAFFLVNGGSVAEKNRLARARRFRALPLCRRFLFDLRRSGTEGSRWLFLFFVDAVLLCFACVQTLCAFELVHQSNVFYSGVLQVFYVWQLSLCTSLWNGCVKVSRCCGCVRSTIVFCSWESYIVI